MSLLSSTTLRLSAALSCVALAGYASSAHAVVLPSTPSFDPGQIQQRLSLPQSTPEVEPEAAKKPQLPPQEEMASGEVHFTLTSVTVEGGTVFSEAELQEEYGRYLNTDISLGTLNEIADHITVRYRNAGYILSRAVVPEQRIEGGHVTIRVVEGYVSNVQFSGLEEGEQPGILADYAQHIAAARPLDSKTLERYLLLMQDLPGQSARAILQPSENESGSADLIIAVGNKPLDATLTFDNRGTRYVGPAQGGVTLSANNVAGWHERTQFHGVLAPHRELQYSQFQHEQPIGSEGTKWSVSFSHTESQPAYTLAIFDIQSQDNNVSATITHPFLRSRMANFYGSATLEARNTVTDVLGTLFYQDKLRILRLNSAYDFVDDSTAVNRLSTTFSKGFGWDDNSANYTRSRGNARPDFMKMEAQASRLQPLDDQFSIYAGATAQVSANTLVASEQFALGGPSYGSAYDPSELTGDSGFALRSELQYTRTNDFDFLPTYQLYGFWDFGKVWIRDIPSSGKFSPSLASLGMGLRFSAEEPISGGLEIAVPLTKHVTAFGQDGTAPRAFFSLLYKY